MSSSKHIIKGKFSGSRLEEIFVSRGKTLKLLQINAETGVTCKLVEREMSHAICSLTTLIGESKDFAIVGLDLGSIAIFEYVTGNATLKQVAHYKSGLFHPGIQPRHVLSVPNSSVFVTKTKKQQKMICDLKWDPQHTPTKFSPWKTNESETTIADMVCVETPKDSSPLLACLELNGSSTAALLQFHELILESKNVNTLQPNPMKLDFEINLMISISKGILLFGEDKLFYVENGNKDPIQCHIPQRTTGSGAIERVIFHTFARLDNIVYLLSNEGEIYTLTVETRNDEVTNISLKYFDLVPKASAICVLNSEIMFVFCDFGSYQIYKIKANPTENEDTMFASSSLGPTKESERSFDAKPLHHLVKMAEFDAGVESIFETSTSNLDLPACNTMLTKVAFGKRNVWTGVTIEIHRREMKIYDSNKRITTENLTNLSMQFKKGRGNALKKQKKWNAKWISKDADYKLTFYAEEDYNKFVQSHEECYIPDAQQERIYEAKQCIKIGVTSTPKKSTSISRNDASSEQLREDLERIFAGIGERIIATVQNALQNALQEAFSEAIPQIITAFENRQSSISNE